MIIIIIISFLLIDRLKHKTSNFLMKPYFGLLCLHCKPDLQKLCREIIKSGTHSPVQLQQGKVRADISNTKGIVFITLPTLRWLKRVLPVIQYTSGSSYLEENKTNIPLHGAESGTKLKCTEFDVLKALAFERSASLGCKDILVVCSRLYWQVDTYYWFIFGGILLVRQYCII